MDKDSSSHVSSRVLKLNVGFLLNDGPGNSHTSEFDFPKLRVSDDLLVKYLRGPLRLSRTKEGILVQAKLKTAIDGECYRCLDAYTHEISIDIEELFATHYNPDAEFSIGDDGILDFGPLLRQEVLIEVDYGRPFRPDANGICQMCKVPIQEKLRVNEDDHIDPRLAVLKKLLDSN